MRSKEQTSPELPKNKHLRASKEVATTAVFQHQGVKSMKQARGCMLDTDEKLVLLKPRIIVTLVPKCKDSFLSS